MSAKVLLGPNSCVTDVWPGVVDLNSDGVALADEMLGAFQDIDGDEEQITLADYACLKDWPRQGRPHRNTLAEYLKTARDMGPDAEAAFCAVLGDFVSICCQGSVPEASWYAEQYVPEEVRP
jgi:hypothetical protein